MQPHASVSAECIRWEVVDASTEEREFGVVMPHGALNEVKSVDDAVGYWERRLAAVEEERIAAAKHYTVQHPPNVVIGGKGRGGVMREWWQQHAINPHARDDPLAALAEEEGERIVFAGRSEGEAGKEVPRG